MKLSNKYVNFADVFFSDLVSKFIKHNGINNYTIKLVNGQQPFYGLIYYLRLVEFESLKAFIEINLANGFIRPFKSSASTPILFDQKLDRFLRLCVNYRGFNNFTIKNWYPLPLVGDLLDKLRRARRFTQLDFINAYY